MLMYIYRTMNDYLRRLLTAQLPMVMGMLAIGAPDFAYIMEELVGGRLLQITSLTDDFFEMPEAPPVAPQHPALTGGMSADEVEQVEAQPVVAVVPELSDNQNPKLKKARAAAGITGIYRVGSPF